MRGLRALAAAGAALLVAAAFVMAPAGEVSACAGKTGDNAGLERSPAFENTGTSYAHKHQAPRFGFTGRIVIPNANAGMNASPNSAVSSFDHQSFDGPLSQVQAACFSQ